MSLGDESVTVVEGGGGELDELQLVRSKARSVTYLNSPPLRRASSSISALASCITRLDSGRKQEGGEKSTGELSRKLNSYEM